MSVRSSPGGTNDNLAWKWSDIYLEVIQPGILPTQYFYISDEALTATESVLSPYGGTVHRKSVRFVVGRKVGHILFIYICEHTRWAKVIRVCAELHNMCCIDFGMEEATTMPEDHADGDSAQGFSERMQLPTSWRT
eukprot:scaffold985_cov202-Ochromonas_danica.AAC.1